MEQNIHQRLLKLKDVALGHSKSVSVNSALSNASYDCGVDALLAIYAECSDSTGLSKDKNIAKFLHNYEDTVKALKEIRLKAEDFEVKSLIGQGHFGEVQVVRERSTGEVFAMKVLKKAHILQQADAAFFMQERDIMAWNKSPWITSLSYAFQDTTSLYLVMDFHPGGDLLTVMERQEGGMGEEEASFYLAEIAAGLKDLHTLGFVHRDVKPENVIITRTGHTKLVDFGSAARLDTSGNVMESRLPVGTPEYIAPEVLTSLDKAANYGVCCDWWSLGIIAYELLYQATPFEGETTSQTYAKIMNYKSSLSFPSDVDVSSNARDLISKLLRDPTERIGFEGVRSHQFFANVRWDHLIETVPPYIPSVLAPDDTSNFDTFEKKKDDSIPSPRAHGFSGKSLPFVGFTFTRFPLTSVATMDQCSSAMDSVAKDTAHSSLQCVVEALKSQLEGTRRELQEVKDMKASLEKECVIYQGQLEDYQKKLDLERLEGQQYGNKALEMLSQVREHSRKVQEHKENEAKAGREDLMRAVEQLEQDRLAASKRARRLQEDLKVAQEIRDAALKKVTELKGKLTEVKHESRREVEALRVKLGKVTKDADGKVAELQNQLAEAHEKHFEVMKKARMLEDTSKKLEYEQEQAKLNDRLDQSETIARLKKELFTTQDSSLKVQAELMALKEQFELENGAHSLLKDQYESLKQIMTGLEAKLDAADSRNRMLVNSENNVKAELQDVRQRLGDVIHDRDSLQKRMEEEKRAITQQSIKDREAIITLTSARDMLESRLQQLQQQASAPTSFPPGRERSEAAQIEKLLAEVSSLKSQLSSAMHTLEDIQEKCRRAETQHKMDESRLKDQVKSLQEKLNVTSAKSDEQTEKFFDLQRSKRQLENENSSLRVAVSNTESLNRSLQTKLSKSTEEASKYERVKKEFEAMEREVETSSAARNQLASGASALEAEKNRLQITVSELQTASTNWKKRVEAQELEMCLLRQNLKSLEEQQSETLSTMQEMKAHEDQWKERQRVLEGDLEIAENQVDDACATIEREKAARLAAEARAGELQATLNMVTASHEEDMQRAQQQIVAQKQIAAKCSDDRALIERQLHLKEIRLAEVEKEVSTEKQVSSKLYDDVCTIRREHNVLKAAHSKLMQECAQREAQLSQVDLALREKESADSVRSLQETRLQATIAQQYKLIDYLQGGASSSSPLGSRVAGFKHSGRKSRDPLKQLAEWNNLKGLASKAKGGLSYDSPAPSLLVTPCEVISKSKFASPLKVEDEDAPPTSVPPSVTQTSKKRGGGFVMQHNIPHSFKEKCAPICKSYVCVVCKGSIKARQKLCKCTHCDVACHPSCAGSVPNTCGLPAELAEHMAVQEEPSPKKLRSGEEEEVGRNKSGEETCMVDAAAKSTMSLVIKKEKMAMLSQGTGLRVEGWLILGKDTLSFSTRDSSRVERKPEVQIFLRAPDTTFVVAATVNRKQLPFPFTSPSRLTNTFMLEQHSSTGATYYVFVALDSESKHQWVRCLEEVIAGERQTALSTKRELKAVTVVPLKTSTTCNSLNMSVTSSMMDDDDSMV